MLSLSMALVRPNLVPTWNSNSLKQKPLSHSQSHSHSHVPPPTPTRFRLSVSAAETAVGEAEKLGVVVKGIEKSRVVLKFIWMEKNIGIGLDQMVPGHGTIPLSPYYFWPRKDAWEELKELLETKPWISQKQMIILLNQATDIINLWQQSGANLS